MNWSTKFTGMPFHEVMTPSRWKHMYFVLSSDDQCLLKVALGLARNFAWAGIFKKYKIICVDSISNRLVGWLIGLIDDVSTLFVSFNAELSHFGLVWFYGISTIVGYLMPNLFLYI